jgi:hypothetical protein
MRRTRRAESRFAISNSVIGFRKWVIIIAAIVAVALCGVGIYTYERHPLLVWRLENISQNELRVRLNPGGIPRVVRRVGPASR